MSRAPSPPYYTRGVTPAARAISLDSPRVYTRDERENL